MALLHNNTRITIDKLSGLSDEDLSISAPFEMAEGGSITTVQVIEWFLIGHAHGHLGEIQETLNA